MPDFQEMVRERLRQVHLSPGRESEIVEELSQHLRDRYESLRSRGAGDAEALRAIAVELEQRDFAADIEKAEGEWTPPLTLGAGGSRFWPGLWQDLRYGLRVLRLNPAFTTVCVLSLALGIGANTAIFQLLDSIRMKALPVKDPQELAIVRPINFHASGHVTGRYSRVTQPQWEQIRAQQQGFSGVFAWGTADWDLAQGGQVRPADGLWVSGEFFDVLGVQPVLGRVLHASDDHAGCGTPGAVISAAFWQSEFGGDASIVGKTITLERHVFPILGVTPANFFGIEVGHKFDVALPVCSEPIVDSERPMVNDRHAWWLAVMGRLKPGWSLEKASAQLQAISPGIEQATLPEIYDSEHAKHYLAMTFNAVSAASGFSNIRHEYETPLWLLLAIAALVLLIACANLANLMLARASAREREIAVRLALGAARGRLVRQLLTESLLLAFTGALLGVAAAGALSRLLVYYLGSEDGSRIFLSLSTDWRVFGFAALLAVLTCAIFGLAPAIKATSADPARILSLGNRSLSGPREHFSLRRILVVSQIAISLVLITAAFLFTGSLRKILTLDAGFQRDGLLVMDVDFTALNVPKPQREVFVQNLLDHVRAIPGIEDATATSVVPLGGNFWNDQVIIDGKVMETPANMSHISPGYFKTMGTPLLAGRDFDERDTATSPKVVIVNQEFANKFFAGQNPVGKTFRIDVYRGENQPEYQIIGMVKNSKYFDLREDFPPLAFYPNAQDERPKAGTDIIVRSSLALDSLLDSLRHTVAEANSGISIDFHVFDQQVKESLLRERLLATLSGCFGGLAIVLAAIGLYGVMAYMVARRTNEIGIRMALGAVPLRILTMVVREAATLLGIGLAIGLGLALLAGKSAATLLYGLKPHDPAILAAASMGLALVAFAATLLPARRAAHLDPMAALRVE